MQEFINEQIELIQTELEMITNPYERADIRVKLINALTGVGNNDVSLEGKASIKNDTVKPIDFKEEKTKKSSKTKESKMKSQEAEPAPIDIDNDPAVNTPIMYTFEDNSELDVTEIYNALEDFEGEDSEKIEAAAYLQAYGLIPTFETLNLTNSYNKMLLAYYMVEFGLEEINGFVYQVSDENFNDIYEFINEDNLQGFLTQIEANISDDEE